MANSKKLHEISFEKSDKKLLIELPENTCDFNQKLAKNENLPKPHTIVEDTPEPLITIDEDNLSLSNNNTCNNIYILNLKIIKIYILLLLSRNFLKQNFNRFILLQKDWQRISAFCPFESQIADSFAVYSYINNPPPEIIAPDNKHLTLVKLNEEKILDELRANWDLNYDNNAKLAENDKTYREENMELKNTVKTDLPLKSLTEQLIDHLKRKLEPEFYEKYLSGVTFELIWKESILNLWMKREDMQEFKENAAEIVKPYILESMPFLRNFFIKNIDKREEIKKAENPDVEQKTIEYTKQIHGALKHYYSRKFGDNGRFYNNYIGDPVIVFNKAEKVIIMKFIDNEKYDYCLENLKGDIGVIISELGILETNEQLVKLSTANYTKLEYKIFN
jgi:hypothetical protein